MQAVPKALPLWSAELRTNRLDQSRPGQWPPSPSQGLCGRRGAEAQQGHDIGILRYCIQKNSTSKTISSFFYPDIRISRYFLQYRDHIGPDIGEKPDIGFGKERVCPDIVPISVPISGKNPISGTFFAISGLARNGYVPILYRYRRRYCQYRVRYREKNHDIVSW
jgi:hypothetical protein